jgi:hypothetical protein
MKRNEHQEEELKELPQRKKYSKEQAKELRRLMRELEKAEEQYWDESYRKY